jgi:hypothetical protein
MISMFVPKNQYNKEMEDLVQKADFTKLKMKVTAISDEFPDLKKATE